MILHITFSDGSNPWVSLPSDRHTIAKQWRRWMKYHSETAQPEAHGENGWICCQNTAGEYVVFNPSQRLAFNWYKTLGHALAALDRLGGAGT